MRKCTYDSRRVASTNKKGKTWLKSSQDYDHW
jgi:hypothetical protein